MLEAWKEASGWLAAIVSCLSFGSFAVPIKSNECRQNDVDPLVFQSYKTAMCLLTSWLVLPLGGQPFYFTPWGIISGLFWVPAGVAAIYAVKSAGLAISQGLWSSIIVMVSFTWGIFIFQERVKSIGGALLAVGMMIVGLWGMSFYSSPATQPNYEQVHSISSLVDIVPHGSSGLMNHTHYNDHHEKDGHSNCQHYQDGTESASAAFSNATNHISLSPTRTGTKSRSYDQENYEVVHSLSDETKKKFDDDLSLELEDPQNNTHNDDGISYNSSSIIGHHRGEDDQEISQRNYHNQLKLSNRSSTQHLSEYDDGEIQDDNHIGDDDDYFLGDNPTYEESMEREQQSRRRATIISQRTLGLMAAVFNGVWGGSIMVPMHYAPEKAHGIGYVISFAIGATIITICLWIARFAYYYFYEGMTFHGSYHSLPPFHFKVMWKPGGTAGLLWSIGNLSSMISVQQLGEGVGYSLTQASMLVSGIWGIFYFREVEGCGIRVKWFLSALITIGGILMLSFEHVNDGNGSSDSV